MTIGTQIPPSKLAAVPQAKLLAFFMVTLLGGLLLLPRAGYAAQDSPAVNELKQKAQQAFINGRYAEAEAANLEIAGKHPESEARRYAVQMLGTIYENNLVDIKKALKWDREYLENYAGPRQVSFYQEKIASLEKLMQQQQAEAFRIYQAIRFADQGDEVMVKQFEALLKDHPDFLLKDKVRRELAYAYARMDERRQSHLAFQALSQGGEKGLAESDQAAAATADRYWRMTFLWGSIAWGVVIILWAVALLMNPWKRLSTASIRTFVIWAVLWTLLTAIRMPTFYTVNTEGDQFVLQDTAVYAAAGLNLMVLFWLLLLARGKFWQTRPRALVWAGPVLTLLMTAAVFYLFMIHQQNGPEIMDIFAARYRHWTAEWLHLQVAGGH